MHTIEWGKLHGAYFENKKVLVTGGAGFIGSHLCDALYRLGAEVVAIDNLCGGSWDNLPFDCRPRIRTITGSVLDESVLDEAMRDCQFVFHQAALGSVPRSVAEPRIYWQVNVEGTVNVLESAKRAGVKRVLLAGSSSAYGDPPTLGLKEESMPALPRSPYAATKLAGEHAMRAWSHSYGLDTCVLRYFNVFGPRQNANSAYAAVIAAFATALLNGKRCKIYGDGTQSRDFTFVANVVHGNLLAASHVDPLLGEVFNVALGGRISILELHDRMRKLCGIHEPAQHLDARRGDVLHSQADIRKAQRILGYEPVVGFDEGLKETLQWYRKSLAKA